MINYIKAELYRIFNKKNFYVFISVLMAACIGFNIFLKVDEKSSVYLFDLMKLGIDKISLLVPVILIFIVIDIVNCDEYKNKTLKNMISVGMPRNKFIICKFIISIVILFVIEMVILVAFYGSGALIFNMGNGITEFVPIFILRICLVSIPWMSIIALGLLLNSILNDFNMFLYAYSSVFIGIPIIIRLFSLFPGRRIFIFNGFLITSLIMTFGDLHAGIFKLVIADALSLIYIVVFLSMNIKYFSNKDIN